MRTLGEEADKQGFDLKVTHRDPKSGQIIDRTPYKLRVVGSSNGQRRKLFERPVGSGNCFDGQGRPAGRWVIEEVKGKKMEMHKPEAEHIEWTAPLTADQKLAKEALENKVRVEELERELRAMKMEKEKKNAPAPAPKAQTQGKKEQGNDGKGA